MTDFAALFRITRSRARCARPRPGVGGSVCAARLAAGGTREKHPRAAACAGPPGRYRASAHARSPITGPTNTSDVAVLGIGGSSLGGQALAELLPVRPSAPKPRLTFFDNADPFTFAAALKSFDLRTTRFIAISKSGGTAETLSQTLAAVGRHRGGRAAEKYLAAAFHRGDGAEVQRAQVPFARPASAVRSLPHPTGRRRSLCRPHHGRNPAGAC